MDDEEYNAMDEVITNLWIGDLSSALDATTLAAHNIKSVLTAMRGRVSINQKLIQHQILLDDEESADVLVHLPASIAFIEGELEKGRGVLVHCQAGMSRSATVVAAYLMYSRRLDATAALDLIREKRPIVQPNDGFLYQLEVFYSSSYNISRNDKATRMFYLQRAVEEVMNGDGTVETEMFAKFPKTPSDSTPATPGGPRRRIRCKKCRQELATREHMLDHGQLNPGTPAFSSPQVSRRPSMNTQDSNPMLQRSGMTPPFTPSGSRRPSEARSKRPSFLATERPMMAQNLLDSLSMSALDTEDDPELEAPPIQQPRRRSTGAGGLGGLKMTPMEPTLEEKSESEHEPAPSVRIQPLSRSDSQNLRKRSLIAAASERPHGLSDQLSMSSIPPTDKDGPSPSTEPAGSRRAAPPSLVPMGGAATYMTPAELAAQLQSNPKLTALRSPSVVMSPITPNTPAGFMPLAPLNPSPPLMKGGPFSPPLDKVVSPPILSHNRCSGYFLEPMKWMEPFLEDGQLAGKILCPNPKCGAKLGNYDWAGVHCSCGEWVTPGFCIPRSKVDEVV